MREMYLDELKVNFRAKSSQIERKTLRLKATRGRAIRTKPRDYEESRILTKIFMRKFTRAVAEGKIIFQKRREWYYELPSDER